MKKYIILNTLVFLYTFCSYAHNSKSLIFIRHGTTDWSWEMMAEGTKDLPLNQVGKTFIANIADRLYITNIVPEQIISSPLLRCRQTAEIIQNIYFVKIGKKIPILIKDEIQGPKYGNWSSEIKKDIQLIVQNIKKMNLPSLESKKLLVEELKKFPKTDKEPWEDFIKRALLAIEQIEKNYQGTSIVITHGSFCEEYLRAKGKHSSIEENYWKTDNRDPLVINYNQNDIELSILK